VQGRHVYDRDAFLAYLDLPVSWDPGTAAAGVAVPRRLCHLRSPFDRVCLDHQRFYKLQAHAEDEAEALVRERQCARLHALRHDNLRTGYLFSADMGLDGDSVRVAGRPPHPLLRQRLRLLVRDLVGPVRDALVGDPRQAMLTLIVLFIYAAVELSIFTISPLQSLVRSARQHGGLRGIWVCQLILPEDTALVAVARATTFLAAYLWNALQSRPKLSPAQDMDVVQSFSEAVRALRLPPALRRRACPPVDVAEEVLPSRDSEDSEPLEPLELSG
jgi:hypothetical protein